MQKDQNRLHVLMQALSENEISKEELNELVALLNHSDNEAVIDSAMEKIWSKEKNATANADDQLYSRIVASDRFTKAQKTGKSFPFQSRIGLFYYAASVILLCGLGLAYFTHKSHSTPESATFQSTKTVQPATTNNTTDPILTLANGEQIVLSKMGNGTLNIDPNVAISKTAEGKLTYHQNNSNLANSTEISYHTISTPVGGSYQLTLPDGTKVWLNAMSSLKFPVAFASNQRSVELSGEGYFEVASNPSKPFTVAAKRMNVRVLGTHFNVSAYGNDNVVRATLVEGSIQAENSLCAMLVAPGQQAVLTDGSNTIKVKPGNVQDAIAWTTGHFVFRNEPIEEIMKKISRWYNIEVKYDGDSKGQQFGGKYYKQNSLSELLSSLALTGTVKFKIDGRRVTVMQ